METGVSYGNMKTATVNPISTIQTQFIARGLESQTTYLLGAYVNSSVGNSETSYLVFKTSKSSNGAVISMAFSAVEDHEALILALSKVFRVSIDKLSVLTVREVLISSSNEYVGEIMNTRQYVYDIVLGPNPEDDSIVPLETVNEFLNS